MSKALNNIDLTAAQRKEVAALLQRYLPDTEVWAYGSRVKFTAKPHSDLDMVAFAAKEQSQAVANLREAFAESYLPFRVDLFVWDEVPEGFHGNIEEAWVVVQEKEKKNLPNGWQQVILGDVITINDATYSSKDKWSFINYLDTGNLTNGKICEVKKFTIGTDKIPSRAKRKIQPGDIVYSTVRPNQKHFGIIKNLPENLLVSTAFVTIRGKKEKADTNFVYFLLAQRETIEILQTIGEHSTSAYPSIKPSDIEGLKFNLPPLPEQKAIAQILGSLDDKIELNRWMNETLEAMAQALFKDWFVDFGPTRAKAEGRAPYLTSEIWDIFPDALDDKDKPVGWQIGSIGDLADTNHQSWTVRNHPTTVEYIDLSNAKWGNIDAVTALAWEDAPSRARRVARMGDTIVGTTRPGNGSFVYISQNGLTVSTGFAVLSPREVIYRDVVYIAATRLDNIERLANLADGHGGAYPAVKPKEVSDTELVLPGDAVLSAFADLVSPLRAKIENVKVESRSLSQTRDLLLPKLMSGEIRLREAERVVEAVV